MSTKLADKIAETRAAIADLMQQVGHLEIKLQAYLELEGSDSPAVAPRKAVDKRRKRTLFKSEIPWDRGLAAVRSKVGMEFTTDDVHAALAALRSFPKRSSLRSKLGELTRDGALVRVDDGRYRFATAAEKKAA